MFKLVRTLLGRMRYRRRWSVVAAEAVAAADSATAEANRLDRAWHVDHEEKPARGLGARTTDSGGPSAQRPARSTSAV